MLKGLLMKYFVLKPEGCDAHARASRAALLTYASVMDRSNATLARDLRSWVEEEDARCEKSSDPIKLDGFVLVDHRGVKKMWAPESTRLISTYAMIHKRIILDDGDYQIERERMKVDGWSIDEATMVIEVKDGRA